jgi:hypothetical protein
MAAALVVLGAAFARAGVDVETTASSFKAKGTLSSAADVGTYRFQSVQGAKLSLSLTALHKAPLTFSLALTDPNSNPVTIGTDVLKTTKTGVSVTGLLLPASGEYRLDVSTTTGAGDYALALTTAPQLKWTSPLGIAGVVTFAFSAPVGSTVGLSVKAAAKSPAVPRFGLLQSGAYSTDLSTTGHTTATSHTTSVANVGGTGDFSVQIQNSGTDGNIVAVAVVQPPRTKRPSFDLRGVALGRPQGAGTEIMRTVGETGGTVKVTDASSDLNGAAVSIPPAALSSTLPISIASAPAPTLPGPDLQGAGPAVDFGPSGTVFSQTALVSLPFDFRLLPAGTDPSQIRVFVQEASGATSDLAPAAVDVANGLVRVQTSGFSTCIPYVPAGIIRLGVTSSGGLKAGGDGYWVLGLHDDMGQVQQNNDSRSRDFEVSIGEVAFYGDNTFQVANERRQIQVDEPDDGTGGVNGTVQTIVQPENDSGTYAYDTGGQTISVTGGGSASPSFYVSRGGDVMVGRAVAPTDAKAELTILLRKNASSLTVASAAGTWSFGGSEIDASGGGGPVSYRLSHVSGTMTLDGKGGFTISGAQRRSKFDGGNTAWTADLKTLAITGTYSVEAAGTVILNIPPDKPGDTGNVLRLYPGPNADSFLGTDRDAQQNGFLVLFLIRQGTGLSLSNLSGPYRTETIEVDTATYTPGTSSTTVGDVEERFEDISTTLSGTKSAHFSSSGHEVRRDPSVSGGVSVTNGSSGFDVTMTLASNGVFKVTQADGSAVGAVSPDAAFGFLVTPTTDARGSHLFAVFVKSPPAK